MAKERDVTLDFPRKWSFRDLDSQPQRLGLGETALGPEVSHPRHDAANERDDFSRAIVLPFRIRFRELHHGEAETVPVQGLADFAGDERHERVQERERVEQDAREDAPRLLFLPLRDVRAPQGGLHHLDVPVAEV